MSNTLNLTGVSNGKVTGGDWLRENLKIPGPVIGVSGEGPGQVVKVKWLDYFSNRGNEQ